MKTENLNFGKLLTPGLIVKLRSPHVDFDEALAAGPSKMMDYFDAVIGGLREGHIEHFRKLGLFSKMEEQTGLNIDLGSWEEVSGEAIDVLLEIVNDMSKFDETSLKTLMDDFRSMVLKAQIEKCSIGFMLAC